jgi:hypothetical protein
MAKSAKSIGTVTLDDECVTKTVEVLQEELQIPYLDIEQKESLEKIVMMSVAFYLMYCRESYNATTKLTQ